MNDGLDVERAARARRVIGLIGLGVALGVLVAATAPGHGFLFGASDRFNDLLGFGPAVRAGDPYAYFVSNYLPFAYVVMGILLLAPDTAAVAIYGVGLCLALGAFASRALAFLGPRRGLETWLVVLVTYPLLFTIDRANVEGVVVVALVGFVAALGAQHRTAAILCLGFVIAMKGYPVLYGLLWLARGDRRALALSLAVAGAFTVLGSGFYGYDVVDALSRLRPRLAFYQEHYVIGHSGLAFGSSVFGALKVGLLHLGGGPSEVRVLASICTGLFAGGALAVGWAIWRLPLVAWEQVTLVALAFVALPLVSADYRLLHLLYPLLLWLRDGPLGRGSWLYLVGFVTLMVPKSFGFVLDGSVSLNVVVNPIVMVVMAVAIVGQAAQRRAANLV